MLEPASKCFASQTVSPRPKLSNLLFNAVIQVLVVGTQLANLRQCFRKLAIDLLNRVNILLCVILFKKVLNRISVKLVDPLTEHQCLVK